MKNVFKVATFLFVLVLGIFLMSACTSKIEPIVEDATFKRLSEVKYSKEKKYIDVSDSNLQILNDFSYHTFQNMDTENNLIYSPASFYMALSMLTEGAKGSSRSDLLAFQEANRVENLRAINEALFSNNSYENNEGKARIANSFWSRLDFQIYDEYVNNLKNNYFAEGFSCDFGLQSQKNICNWINNNTFDFLNVKEEDLEIDDDIVLMLINTIYFQNKWKEKFDEANTKKETFYLSNESVQADFMHHSVTNAFYKGEKFIVANDTFTNDNYITYILPNEDVSIIDVINSDDFYNVICGDVKYKMYEINYSVPKFKYQNELDLKELSKSMGLTSIFDSATADLSGIASADLYNLYVSMIKQIAGIELSEEGVKAAAVTIIGVKDEAVSMTESVEVKLNRPFIYLIKDSAGEILFMGILNNPLK